MWTLHDVRLSPKTRVNPVISTSQELKRKCLGLKPSKYSMWICLKGSNHRSVQPGHDMAMLVRLPTPGLQKMPFHLKKKKIQSQYRGMGLKQQVIKMLDCPFPQEKKYKIYLKTKGGRVTTLSLKWFRRKRDFFCFTNGLETWFKKQGNADSSWTGLTRQIKKISLQKQVLVFNELVNKKAPASK